jgi:hypothetical protein
MAGEVYQFIVSEIATLRSEVMRAGALNATVVLNESAESRLENVLGFVVVSHEATFETVQSVAAFARLLYTHTEISEIEQARRGALVAIDALAVVLNGSTLSQVAHTLGLKDNQARPSHRGSAGLMSRV